MNLKTIEERLVREHQLPEAFQFYAWKCYPPGGDTIYVSFSGGVVSENYKSGPRKGRPNFSKATDCRDFAVTIEKANQWEAEYEQQTGNCRHCRGSKQQMKSWSVDDGTTYCDCRKCQGTGKWS